VDAIGFGMADRLALTEGPVDLAFQASFDTFRGQRRLSLKLKDLRGHVVLIEFWTFGCYNCRNTLPYVKGWDARYRAKGFTVIGVHSPEFDEERKIEHLRRQVASLGIMYPVVTDNDYQTWKAYNVEAWPTTFLLDKQGRIRWRHVGEGGYTEAERLIQKLIAE